MIKKFKDVEFISKLSIDRGARVVVVGLIGIAAVSGVGFYLFNSSSNKESKQDEKPQNLLVSDTNINQDPTVNQIRNLLNTRSMMSNNQSAEAQVNPPNTGFDANKLKKKFQDEQDNKMVTIGRVADYKAAGGYNNDNDSSVPMIVGNNSNAADQAYANDEKTMADNARKAQTRVSLNFSQQASTSTSSGSAVASAPVTQVALGSNVNGNVATGVTSSTGAAGAAKAGYKPVTDNSGFSINTGANDSSDDLTIKPLKSPYVVKASTFIPAIMVTGVNSDVPGAIIARVRQNVYNSSTHTYLMIPKNSLLMGSYSTNVQYGQERVIAAWNKLIYPDGTEIRLEGQPGADVAGFGGMYDQINRHYWSLFGTTFVLSVITAGMEYNQQQYSSNFNGGQSFGNSLSNSTGQMFGNAATQVLQKGINVAPTLTIRNGYKFNILLTQDVVLPGPVTVKVYD